MRSLDATLRSMDITLWQRLGLLAIAGALGTLARFGVSAATLWATGPDINPHRGFPWATLIVNVVGSLVFGLVWVLAEERARLSPEVRLVILTGFLGAFTTFSSYAFDTGRLLSTGAFPMAFANIMANNALGLGAFFAGAWFARRGEVG